jgi:GTP-binding protein Era
VLNKVDRVAPKRLLLPLADKLHDVVNFDEVFMVSALENDGVDDIRNFLMHDCSLQRPWLFNEDTVCDMSEQQRCAELIREKVFQRLNQEIPYSVNLRLGEWAHDEEGKLCAEFILTVENLRHKGMIIGKDGETLKGIQRRAQESISKSLGKPVSLKLDVIIRHRNASASARDLMLDTSV